MGPIMQPKIGRCMPGEEILVPDVNYMCPWNNSSETPVSFDFDTLRVCLEMENNTLGLLFLGSWSRSTFPSSSH